MNINYRKDAGANFLVIEDPDIRQEDPFSAKMLRAGAAANLLSFQSEHVNGKTVFLYDISGKQAFIRAFEYRKISYDILISFILSLKSLSESLSEHLLDTGMVFITGDSVFTDYSCSNFYYCCIPGMRRSFSDQLKDMFDLILNYIDYDDKQLVTLAFSLSRIAQNDNFTLSDIFSAAEKAESENLSAEISENERTGSFSEFHDMKDSLVSASPSASKVPARRRSPFIEKSRIYFKGRPFSEIFDAVNSGRIIRLIKDTPLPAAGPVIPETKPSYTQLPEEASFIQEPSDISDTASLDLSAFPFHRLASTDEAGPVILLDHFPFTIGKSTDAADHHLDRPTISRLHCRIYENEDGTFAIEDLNSRNGTSVNDISLDPYSRQPLMPGDTLLLADISFLFL